MIYLDSAATTFQKPPSVSAAMQNALLTMSSPGRGGYPAAMKAAETAFQCRSELRAVRRWKPGACRFYLQRHAWIEYRHQKSGASGRESSRLRV